MQYIHDNDLLSYRLTCKLLAELGKPELFHTITFRCSWASMSRLKRIMRDRDVSRLVRRLIWDANRWRIGVDVRDWHEWTRHCRERAESTDPRQSALYTELAASRQYWELYLSRLEDERSIMQETGIWVNKLWAHGKRPLPNLEEVHVIKGHYRIKDRQICTMGESDPFAVTIPLKDWRGDHLSPEFNLSYATIWRDAAIWAKNWQFNGLTLFELRFVSSYVRSRSERVDYKSIKIRVAERHCGEGEERYMRALAIFVARSRNLESISLDMSIRSSAAHDALDFRTVQNAFEIKDVEEDIGWPEGPSRWPKLRTLSLRNFITTADGLLSLVARHSSTLRDLKLHALVLSADGLAEAGLVRPGSWLRVLQTISATTPLETVVLSGNFRYIDNAHSCDFDVKSRAENVAAWMLNGGHCPLPEEYWNSNQTLCHGRQ